MRSYLQRIATGPEMSKDLSTDEAEDGMRLVLGGMVDPVQAGVFLIALRMKRETLDENIGALRALRNTATWAEADVDDLVDLAEPYDGFLRHCPVSAFLPAVLAAAGVPTVLHGCRQLGPKWGATTHKVLKAAGARVDRTSANAARLVARDDAGWAYVDVEQFHPALGELAHLRELIVKRPLLATLDKLVGPLRARGRNHLVVGFVHSGYERLLIDIARAAGYDSTMVVRGLEGGVVPPLDGAVKGTRYAVDAEPVPIGLDVDDFGLDGPPRQPPVPEALKAEGRRADGLAAAAARAGLAALDGGPGPAREALVAAAANILVHLGRGNAAGAAATARDVLTSGAARARFEMAA